ncbi:hypothetical protein [Alteromonas mediterranea]|uniref:hypothetical protein n=1 Tax=Alteromonas mediterranea TaxID=314275 RepID=UPI000355456D|nr:hypothetical protein [Alteromonas mediterranea]AGP87118.1 hypothetical protein I607_16730 [Alteromonas mediterranea U4]AGP91252.1 hypothetical protein I876_17100 [Alteromonas mediterranea U7]AGP93566.1 hypothetical protein I634_09255 [Alteromonas mediterranea U8]
MSIRRIFDVMEVHRKVQVAEAKGQILGAYKLALTNYFRDTRGKERYKSFRAWEIGEGHRFYLVTEKLLEEKIRYYSEDSKSIMKEIYSELSMFYATETYIDEENYVDFKIFVNGG